MYIIGHYNPSVRITAQLLTPLMLCVLILYESGGTYSLTSTLNDRFFGNSFTTDLFTLRVFARNSPKKYFFSYFVSMADLKYEPGLYV